MRVFALKNVLLSTVIASVLLVLNARESWAIDTSAQQAILVDHDTGAVLYEKNADVAMHPSSMSKLMTLYLIFERLKDGSLSLDDQFRVSENAWRKGGSKMFVEVGKTVRLEELLRGIIIQSGNDACIVAAENLSTSEEAFAQEMTTRAKQLGMQASTFVNATGWPDDGHMMTARDLSLLAGHLVRDFPEYYPLFKERSYIFNGILQENRNPLLDKPGLGADGMKTGHTDIGGYGIVASATNDNRRLVLVVNGLGSDKARAMESESLLQWGFREYDNYSLFSSGETVTEAPVWLGDKGLLPLVVKEDVLLTLPRRVRRDMVVKVVYEGPIPAPVQENTQVATLIIEGPGIETRTFPLVAGESVNRLSFVGRLGAAVRHILWGFSGNG
ncbi:MAG: D-alanyl-D-alanine carboxypeptidase [Alphaproteobacteria bacterium RIFOXYD12_FULL_60_8]|nr:MAG: D-alanyl-D-alanine carboxypeptidase [Alphaproteobacteria bacterium RIFOXYD12_FULL_60_8]